MHSVCNACSDLISTLEKQLRSKHRVQTRSAAEELKVPITGDPSQNASLACGEDATRRATA